MFECFACGEPIYNRDIPCPKCGYKFDVENRYCNKFGCAISNTCTRDRDLKQRMKEF